MTSPPFPGPDAPAVGVGQRSVALFDNAPVGLWEADATGTIVEQEGQQDGGRAEPARRAAGPRSNPHRPERFRAVLEGQ